MAFEITILTNTETMKKYIKKNILFVWAWVVMPCMLIMINIQGSNAEVVNHTDKVTIYDFGATGSADDSSAFVSAAAAVNTCVHIPAGTYMLSMAMMDVVNHDLCLVGDGSSVTKLIFSGPGGISFNTSGVNYFHIKGLHLTAAYAGVGTAISANWKNRAGLSQQMFFINDVIVDQTGSGYWNNGLVLTNAANGVIQAFDVHGIPPEIRGNYSTDLCVQLNGTSIDVQITDIHCTSVDTAIDNEQTTQGVYIKGFAAVDVNTGIKSHHNSDMSSQPLMNVNNFHINARSTAINLHGVLQSFFTNGLIYASPKTDNNWIGIKVDGDLGCPSQDILVDNVYLNSALATSATSVNFIWLNNVTRFSASIGLYGLPSLKNTTGVYCGADAMNSYVKINQAPNVKSLYANSNNQSAVNCMVGYQDGQNDTLSSPGGIYNASSAPSINKPVTFSLYGTDTSGAIKPALSFNTMPENSNYTTAKTMVYSRNDDALVNLWTYGANYNKANAPLIDGTGIRIALISGEYMVPASTNLVRFVQSLTVPSATIILPSALGDGQAIQFVNYSGKISSLIFSPYVSGWVNGSVFAANSGLRIRWDEVDGAWYREQ